MKSKMIAVFALAAFSFSVSASARWEDTYDQDVQSQEVQSNDQQVEAQIADEADSDDRLEQIVLSSGGQIGLSNQRMRDVKLHCIRKSGKPVTYTLPAYAQIQQYALIKGCSLEF